MSPPTAKMSTLTADALFSVKDMVFVITGGGSGLGEMMALALDLNGASKVFILGRRQTSLEKAAQRAVNKSLIPIVCDITSKESLQAAADSIASQTPFVNVVVANSGASGPTTSHRPADSSLLDIQKILWSTPTSEALDVINTNVLGSFHTFVIFLPLLAAGNEHPESRGSKGIEKSQFVTITSIVGFGRKERNNYSYMTSKAALVHLTKSLATEFGPRGIRVNSICPGLYITEMTEFLAEGKDLSVPGSMPTEAIPLTRAGSHEDIAGAILFLTSRAGAYLNGNIVMSDGGIVGNEPGTY